MPKAIFGNISGIGSDCITVWTVRKVVEVADENEATKIMLKESFKAYVIPSLLVGVTLRIVGAGGFSPELNHCPPPRTIRKEKAHQ